MSFDVNTSYSQASVSYSATTAKVEVTTTKEATKEAQAAPKTDGYVKSEAAQKPVTYKPDMDKVNSMKAELKGNMAAFRQMVQGTIHTQGGYAMDAMGQLKDFFKVTDEARASAQKAISEDGEWGVEATANRILEFAKALSGGDPQKIETLRKAVEDGFGAAEQVWGGKLPDISYQTRERVMQGFDDWAKEGAGEKAVDEGE